MDNDPEENASYSRFTAKIEASDIDSTVLDPCEGLAHNHGQSGARKKC